MAKDGTAIKSRGCQLVCRIQEERRQHGATMANNKCYTVSLSNCMLIMCYRIMHEYELRDFYCGKIFKMSVPTLGKIKLANLNLTCPGERYQSSA